MLNDKLDSMIMESRKSGDSDKLRVLQAIKSEFSKVIHSGYILDQAKEMNILLKMYEDRQNSAKIYSENGREDLAEIEKWEAKEINQFLPEKVSTATIVKETKSIVENEFPNITMKDMKAIMAKVKAKYPLADGRIISKVVKELISNGNK